jgi:hypothetical protein
VQNKSCEAASWSTFSVTFYSLDAVKYKIDYDIQPNEWAGSCMFKRSKCGFIRFKLNNLQSWEFYERDGERGVGPGRDFSRMGLAQAVSIVKRRRLLLNNRIGNVRVT